MRSPTGTCWLVELSGLPELITETHNLVFLIWCRHQKLYLQLSYVVANLGNGTFHGQKNWTHHSWTWELQQVDYPLSSWKFLLQTLSHIFAKIPPKIILPRLLRFYRLRKKSVIRQCHPRHERVKVSRRGGGLIGKKKLPGYFVGQKYGSCKCPQIW